MTPRSIRKLQRRLFQCPDCDSTTYAPKVKRRTRIGHIKTMWCIHCKRETDQVQIGDG